MALWEGEAPAEPEPPDDSSPLGSALGLPALVDPLPDLLQSTLGGIQEFIGDWSRLFH
jgi:hypothetical protein